MQCFRSIALVPNARAELNLARNKIYRIGETLLPNVALTSLNLADNQARCPSLKRCTARNSASFPLQNDTAHPDAFAAPPFPVLHAPPCPRAPTAALLTAGHPLFPPQSETHLQIGSFREVSYIARMPNLRTLALNDPDWGENPVAALCNYQARAREKACAALRWVASFHRVPVCAPAPAS